MKLLAVLILCTLFFSSLALADEYISSCQELDIDGETYYLTDDIYVDNTGGCFDLYAENAILDFNGHTLYFTESTTSVGTLVRMGRHLDQWTVDRSADGSMITNGRIVQQPSADYNSDASVITMNCNECDITNMYVYSDSPNRQTITIGGRNTENNVVRISNNTLINNDTIIETGHDQSGMIHISFSDINSEEAHGTAIIQDNTLIGRSYLIDTSYSGPGGSLATTKIINNKLFPYKVSRNPYAIRFYHQETPQGSEIINNTIISNNSRGILIGTSSGITIADNYVNVSEVHIDGTDDFGTSFSFRMRYNSYDNVIYGNTFVATAIEGNGISPRAAMISPPENVVSNQFFDNTLIAITKTTAEGATALEFDGADPGIDVSNYLIENNTLIGNNILLDIGGGNGGASTGFQIANTQFVRRTPLTTFYTIQIGSYDPPEIGLTNHHLINPTFENGADDLNIQVTDSGQPKELFLDWTTDIFVHDGTNPIPDAQVEIRTAQGSLVETGTTKSNGYLTTVLSEYRMYSTTTTPEYTQYSPYTFTITKDGQTIEETHPITEPTELSFELTLVPCTNGETRQCGTTDVGSCSYGTQTCTSGSWGSCQGEITATAEICDDTLDNDCDGLTDALDVTDCASNPTECTLPYDEEPCDDCIAGTELVNSVLGWYTGSITELELIANIQNWRTGC